MRFRLLGEVEVLGDDGVARVGHTRERMVLVALLADLNRPVAVGELIDRVWGDRLPQRPRAALYGYLSRLRRVTAALDGVSIRKQPSGYLLEADPMTVDLHRFDSLVARARASETGTAALDLFTRALDLWRGRPLAEAETPWLVALRGDLERRRELAEVDRDDVLLQLGRHEEVLATSSTRAEQASWDERRAGQYMLALYRCGRQADALTHYERVRTRLAEDLGADPTPPLQRLHRQVLAADPALDHPRRPARTVVPRQLPMAPRSFTGRTAELGVLDDLLAPGGDGTVSVSAITGGGGVGKTWLALHWAHRRVERFPDGQLYVNLRGFDPSDEPLSPVTALRGFLDALGVDASAVPGEPDAQAALYRSVLAGRRVLVVLDNARDTAQVLPLLPGSPTCCVLITSRHRLSGLATTHGARSLALDLLGLADAREVLAGHLGRARIAAEPDAVTELLRHCAGLPLALGIVAARAASHPKDPLAALAAELGDATARLDALATDELSADLRAVFTASYRALDRRSATTFRLLGLAPGEDIGLSAAAALTDLPVQRTRVILRELRSLHLVAQDGASRYRLHDLVRLYAAELAAVDADESRLALDRLLGHYRYAASVAANAFEPAEAYRRPPVPKRVGPAVHLAGFAQARDWLDVERPNLLAAATCAAARDRPECAPHLSGTLFRYLEVGGHFHEALTLHTAALGTARSDLSRAGVLAGRGCTLFRLGRYDEALADSLLALELAGDDPATGNMANSALGMIHTALGELDQALRHFHRALALARRGGHRLNETIAQYNLGDTYRMAKRYDEAAGHLARAKANGGLDRYVLTCLGDLHRDRGTHTEALEHYGQAIALARDDTDRGLQAEILISLGDLARLSSDPDQALTRYRQALALAREIHYTSSEADAHYGLAMAHHHLGRRPQALHHAEAALSRYTELSSPKADAVRSIVESLGSGSTAPCAGRPGQEVW